MYVNYIITEFSNACFSKSTWYKNYAETKKKNGNYLFPNLIKSFLID